MTLRKFLLPLFVFALLTGLFLPAAASPDRHGDFDALEEYLEDQRVAANIPGMAIGVVEGSEIIYVRGFGVVGPSAAPVTPQTGFILGSVTKSVTALAVMQLVEAGQVELDAPVNQYLTWFPFADVTVRHLLNQTSGITTGTGRMLMTDTYNGPDAILRHAQFYSQQPRPRAAGEAYEYSNANYAILGALVEAVSGQSYEQYLNEHIFQPLEMTHTYAREIEPGENGMSYGYTQWVNKPVLTRAPYPAGDLPGGFLATSVEDMAHFLVAQMNGGVYNGKQVLSAEGIELMHTGVAESWAGRKYAMGWETGERDGLDAIDHRGDVANFHSNIILIPEHQLGVIFLTNANGTLNGDTINQIAWNAVRLLLEQEPVPVPSNPEMNMIVGIIAGIVLFTLVLIALSIRFIVRAGRGRRSSRGGAVALVVVLALIAGLTLLGLPALFGAPIPVMLLFSPELAWPAIASGAAAAVAATAVLVVLLVLKPKKA